jgi:uncharacterized protein YdeI (YjbR/CyaY-like superfamily)
MDNASELKAGQPVLEFRDQAAFDDWLQANVENPTGVWLKIAKKASPHRTVTHPEALEVAITCGWIDGQRFSYDAEYFLQRFVRRRRRSKWSQINRAKAEELIAQGRMKPSGLEEAQAAQQDGRWEAAYPAQSQASVPPDLQAALDQHPDAKAFFEQLTGQRRYAFLYRLHNAVRPDARKKRIANYIKLLNEGKTLLD